MFLESFYFDFFIVHFGQVFIKNERILQKSIPEKKITDKISGKRNPEKSLDINKKKLLTKFKPLKKILKKNLKTLEKKFQETPDKNS